MQNNHLLLVAALALSIAPLLVVSAQPQADPNPQPVQPQPPQTTNVSIEKSYHGLIHFTHDPKTHRGSPEFLVLRDQAAYEAFVERIPKKEISKTRNPADSNDPLLKKPEIDFTKHVLLVAVRAETMYLKVEIEHVKKVGDNLVATVKHFPAPEHAHMMAYPHGVGTYHAVLVAKPAGTVTSVMATESAAEIKEIKIETTWTGFAHFGGPDNLRRAAPEFMVIRDAEAYATFIERIPELQVTMVNPAPPSNDPLLKKPEVDFSKKMLIVAIRCENIYQRVKISKIEKRGDKWMVTVEHPDRDDAERMQYPLGVGTYCCVLVERFDGTVEHTINVEAKKDRDR